jgi:hypothetical protein
MISCELREPHQYTIRLRSKGTNTMAKELEMNDNSTQDQDRQPQQLSGDRPNPHQLQGKALRVNENSVEDQVSARSRALPRRGSGGKQQKLQGKALQVNKNSAEDSDSRLRPVFAKKSPAPGGVPTRG